MNRSPIKQSVLSEGLRAGDLEDLVLPLVSIDEFQSKISDGDDVVVVGMYVQDADAADDLNRFVQKSAIDILDTERSPAPDQSGYFYVFVEFPNNARLGDNIASLLEEIGPLVGVEKWQIRLRGAADIMPFDNEKLDRIFARRRKRATKNKVKTSEGHHLLGSRLCDTHSSLIEEALLPLGNFHVVADGKYADIAPLFGLHRSPLSFEPRDIGECNRIGSALGGDTIEVLKTGNYYSLVQHDHCVLLKKA